MAKSRPLNSNKFEVLILMHSPLRAFSSCELNLLICKMCVCWGLGVGWEEERRGELD